ncbi:nucleoside-diphosphate-sugar epimerase [Kribbella antiqua]|uniref:Nucleoside-diphosphate-sugar epimerase n=1 Tax=Kribbella antiqua TaxID=2512217 RepID=A0A4V2S3D7_9ACTN|nr:SDR family oxidoreductase [Kribbella antiqua]TCO43890.1 nucleoside-diphosphate-sugar epimerase [Kribbella antiqua]
MRVFVTGATGFVGSAVVRELIGAGHLVTGLARSDQGATSLTAVGADVHRGDLHDLDSLRTAAAAADGVIHTAFIHDFANFPASVETDRHAIETLGDALAGSDRPLIVTSATGLVSGAGVATENSRPNSDFHVVSRYANEGLALSYVDRGVRVSVLRLPPSTHGEGDHAFVPGLIDIARTTGVSAYPGDGSNRWAAVHRLDAAQLYRLALEAPAGSKLHAVAEEGISLRDLAEVIGRHLKVPIMSADADHFGWLGGFATADMPATSTITAELLDWHPTQPGLIADLEKGHYFGTSRKLS